MLVSDGAQTYRAFANDAAILHVAPNLLEGGRQRGAYNIQHVNNYCSRLTHFLARGKLRSLWNRKEV